MNLQTSDIGTDVADIAITQGIDLDYTPIFSARLALYKKVIALKAQRQRNGLTNTMRYRIILI